MISQANCSANTPMGATLLCDQGLAGPGATFRTWAPRAEAVYLSGLFDGMSMTGQVDELLMAKDANGYWSGYLASAREGKLEEPNYESIEIPHNSPTGFVTAFFATITGFSLIWHIWWLVVLGLVGAFATFVVFAWRDVPEYEVPADEVARIDRARRAARAAALADLRKPA